MVLDPLRKDIQRINKVLPIPLPDPWPFRAEAYGQFGLAEIDQFKAMPPWVILNQWTKDLNAKGQQVKHIIITGPENFRRRVGWVELWDPKVFEFWNK